MKKLVMLLSLCAISLLFAMPAVAADYVGSDKCFECHADQFNEWQASGHPWKLRKVEKAQYSGLPLPPGYSWDDISYVIGGANKKARFIDKQGYIITTAKDGSEAKTQYNLQDASWSFYHKGEKKPYKCGPCHMTGYDKQGNQAGMPGMIGTWAEDGIGCEECHGPGSDHVKKPSKKTVKIDRTAEACGKCHQRGGMGDQPPVKGGFIKHHEQINELKAGSHGSISCLDCHNPHQRAIQAKNTCTSCHEDMYKSLAKNIHGKSGLSCKDCHMPKASKSAIKVSPTEGDVRTHLFKINTDPKANMFVTEEKDGKKKSYALGFVTMDFACLNCHKSRDLNWAAKNAKGIHK